MTVKTEPEAAAEKRIAEAWRALIAKCKRGNVKAMRRFFEMIRPLRKPRIRRHSRCR